MRGMKKKLLGLGLLATLLLTMLAVAEEKTAGIQGATAGPYEELQLFSDVLGLVRRSYVDEVPMKTLVQGAINGMLAVLDPHSSFMTPETYREMKIDTSGEFGGLGIEVTIRDGELVVVAPLEDTPAARAGILAGDRILKIDGRVTHDVDMTEAVKLLRGPKGSTVILTIMRDGFDQARDFSLLREQIKLRSVKSRLLESGYGYVRLTQFQESSEEELNKALTRLREENQAELKGLVLDLRNNPGGLLDQAVKVADVFLASGLIVYTEGREEGSRMQFTAHQKGTEPLYPLVVLINGGSASASEIVAGALQDQGRAVILGTQSFGKGSVQTIIPLREEYGLRLTTARYFTPKGRSIQARGITPDVVAAPLALKSSGDATHVHEKDLRNHFEMPPGHGQKSQEKSRVDKGEKSDQAKFGDEPDYQLLRALDLLKGSQLFKIQVPPAA